MKTKRGNSFIFSTNGSLVSRKSSFDTLFVSCSLLFLTESVCRLLPLEKSMWKGVGDCSFSGHGICLDLCTTNTVQSHITLCYFGNLGKPRTSQWLDTSLTHKFKLYQLGSPAYKSLPSLLVSVNKHLSSSGGDAF